MSTEEALKVKIRTLVSSGESKGIEYKKSTSTLKSAMTTVCAYLNSDGGTVLIGVKNDGTVIGQDVTDNTKQEIAKEIIKIEPAANITVDYIPALDGKKVIIISVTKGYRAPYVYDGRAYYRTESSTSKMPQDYYEQLLVERQQYNYNWEESIDNNLSVDDLDFDEIYKTVTEGIKERRVPASAVKEEPESILNRFKLIKGNKLTRAALVLFARDDKIGLLQCNVKLARFKGLDKLGNFIDNQQVYGNVFKLLDQIDAFLNRHLPIASFFEKDQFKRIDKPILPVMAVREALINAIIHRDYSHTGTSIMLAIYDDRLEIWNYGSLPKSITIIAQESRKNRARIAQNYRQIIC